MPPWSHGSTHPPTLAWLRDLTDAAPQDACAAPGAHGEAAAAAPAAAALAARPRHGHLDASAGRPVEGLLLGLLLPKSSSCRRLRRSAAHLLLLLCGKDIDDSEVRGQGSQRAGVA